MGLVYFLVLNCFVFLRLEVEAWRGGEYMFFFTFLLSDAVVLPIITVSTGNHIKYDVVECSFHTLFTCFYI